MVTEKELKEHEEFKKLCSKFSRENGMSIRDFILKKLENTPKNGNPLKKDSDAIIITRKSISNELLLLPICQQELFYRFAKEVGLSSFLTPENNY